MLNNDVYFNGILFSSCPNDSIICKIIERSKKLNLKMNPFYTQT